MNKQQTYHAYLLRCWQEDEANGDPSTWRFCLEGVQDSQRHGFASLESLLAFLQQITRSDQEIDEPGMSSELDS